MVTAAKVLVVASVPLLVAGPYLAVTGDPWTGALVFGTGVLTTLQGFLTLAERVERDEDSQP